VARCQFIEVTIHQSDNLPNALIPLHFIEFFCHLCVFAELSFDNLFLKVAIHRMLLSVNTFIECTRYSLLSKADPRSALALLVLGIRPLKVGAVLSQATHLLFLSVTGYFIVSHVWKFYFMSWSLKAMTGSNPWFSSNFILKLSALAIELMLHTY